VNDDLRAALGELVASYAAERHCPTVAWGIVRDGALAATGSFGSLHDGSAPDEHTVYRIASMTKSFSAAAVVMLRDDGVFQLDDPISRYAPEMRALRPPTADAAAITIRDLLAMSSGLASDDPWADRHLDLTDDELDEIIAAGGWFAVSTGTTTEYSNLGYALLGRVVKRATGTRLQDVVSERLLAPLGMTATTWVEPDHDRWARPHRWRDETFVAEPPPIGDGELAPMGGLWTTVTDLARWVAWLDDAYPPRDDADDGPLCRASRREMQLAHRYIGVHAVREVTAPTTYGYGLLVRDEPAYGLVVAHSGGLPGYGANMRWLPGRRLGLVALTNVTYGNMTELTLRMLDLLHEHGCVPPPPAPLVSSELRDCAERLVALLNEWDDAVAAGLFADNVAADHPYERRRAGHERVIAGRGPLSLTGIVAESHADAKVTVVDADGAELTVGFTLAPIRPPQIQSFHIARPVG
jgi:CubicO group peptidase (beta-lactamase class C family)